MLFASDRQNTPAKVITNSDHNFYTHHISLLCWLRSAFCLVSLHSSQPSVFNILHALVKENKEIDGELASIENKVLKEELTSNRALREAAVEW